MTRPQLGHVSGFLADGFATCGALASLLMAQAVLVLQVVSLQVALAASPLEA